MLVVFFECRVGTTCNKLYFECCVRRLKAGKKLGKYEVEKRRAVEEEDYDTAKLKKVQSDEYRLHVYQELRIPDLLDNEDVS